MPHVEVSMTHSALASGQVSVPENGAYSGNSWRECSLGAQTEVQRLEAPSDCESNLAAVQQGKGGSAQKTAVIQFSPLWFSLSPPAPL